MLRLAIITFGCVAMMAASGAAAQSLSPMRAELVSFTDRGAVTVNVTNPYPTSQHFTLRITDLDGHAIDHSWLSTTSVYLGPAMTRQVLAVVGFEGRPYRTFKVCVTSTPLLTGNGGIQGKVCGKYHFTSAS